MPNQPARKSGKKRVGTVKCPLSKTVCDVFEVRLGNQRAARLYYRGPEVGTIQCYGPAGQDWLRTNLVADQPDAQPAPQPDAQPDAQPAPQPDAQPAPQPENNEQARFLAALGRI